MRDTPFSSAPYGVRSTSGCCELAASLLPSTERLAGCRVIVSALSRIRSVMAASSPKRAVPHVALATRSFAADSKRRVEVFEAPSVVRFSPQLSQNKEPSRFWWAHFGQASIQSQILNDTGSK